MCIYDLEQKLANINIHLERVSLQLQDETISDLDYDLLQRQAIMLDREKSDVRAKIAQLINEQIVNNKL